MENASPHKKQRLKSSVSSIRGKPIDHCSSWAYTRFLFQNIGDKGKFTAIIDNNNIKEEHLLIQIGLFYLFDLSNSTEFKLPLPILKIR